MNHFDVNDFSEMFDDSQIRAREKRERKDRGRHRRIRDTMQKENKARKRVERRLDRLTKNRAGRRKMKLLDSKVQNTW